MNKALDYKNKIKKEYVKDTIENYDDLKKAIETVAYKIYSTNESRSICQNWWNNISKKSNNNFKKAIDGYIFVDENSDQFHEIQKFIFNNKLPDIFSAAKRLGKKIVPVFKIINNNEKNFNIKLYLACGNEIENYLVEDYKAYDTYNTSDYDLIQKINNEY